MAASVASTANHAIALVGARGYVGQLLHALIMHHPCMSPVVVEAREPSDAAIEACRGCAAVALAVPDDAARAWVAALRGRGMRVLDLSGAHRCDSTAHYSIPELHGAPPPDARLVANPGCYPTATLLAVTPCLRADLVEPDGIAVLGQSGTSGAGKGLRDDLHFSELYGNTFVYNVGRHRHTPEIEHHLGAPVSFVSSLLPIVRGLFVTVFVRPKVAPTRLLEGLRSAYADAPWVTVLDEPGQGLGVRHVVGTHQAVVAVGPEVRSGVVPLFASIDNLMRGAASQALHNLNLWLGLEPSLGLPPPLAAAPEGVPGMTRMLP
jgi:N-acetyl-gamma-glutamyl-phosphate reductase